ncbi:MAG TPA: cell division protein FtsQ/DivIB [Pseudomonadales bacterium]|nr:cell division protein FtsQ/DivIB [Pseudomonadales bacterium]
MLSKSPDAKVSGAVRVAVPTNKPSHKPVRLSVFLFVALVMLLAVGVIKVAPAMPAIKGFDVGSVSVVKVMGDLKYIPENAVMETLQPYAEQSLVTLPLRQVQADLEAINWVDKAIVQRKLPSELWVTIVPQKPIARWRDQGLVNNRGEIFMVEEVAEEFLQLPLLEGERESLPEIMATYIEVQKVLRKRGLGVMQLARTPRGSWQLKTISGATVLFGQSDVVEAAQRFVSVYQFLGHGSENKIYDTRHNSGVAVM